MKQLNGHHPDVRCAGVIVTAEHEAGEPLVTFHVAGPSQAALREACELIDTFGGGWFVRSLSTPRTVYSDVQGRSMETNWYAHKRGRNGLRLFVNDPRPEVNMLAAVGRLDLLRPL